MPNDETSLEFSQTLLTTSEAAEILSAHPNSVRKWSDVGSLDCYRIGPGGHRRFRLEDVVAFLTDAKTGLAAP